MKKIRKTIAAFTLALLTALFLGITASAELWGEDVILEYAEYCKTHSYKQQIAMYYETFQADDGGGSTAVFTEEEFLRIKSGENALIVIDYELWDEWFDWVVEPRYNAYFAFLLDNGGEAGALYRIADRNAFTVKEILRDAGIEDQTESLIFTGLETAIEYISGYIFKGYTFIPCESGWNEIDGARYYVKKDGTLATSSLIIGGIRYQFGKDGVCGGKYTGFTKTSKGKRYWKDGKLVKNERFETKSGRRYYADKDGYLTEILSLKPSTHVSGCVVFFEQRVDFKEAVSQSCAVVRAKCVGLTEQNAEKRVYLFLPSEALGGEDIPDSLSVTVMELNDTDVGETSFNRAGYYRYTSADILYREDTEYLLLLTKYSPEGSYYPTANAVIPIGKDGVFENPTLQGRSLNELNRIEQIKDYLPALPKTISYIPRDPDLPLDESDDRKVTFDEAVSQSYSLVRAKCVGLTEQTDEKRVYCFTRSETVTGGSMPYLFYVTVSEYNHGVEDAPGYESTDIHYKEDTEYLLPLRKRSSVFEENDEYYSVGDAVIPIGKNGAFKNPTIQGRRIEGITKLSRLRKYLVDNELSCGQAADEIGTKFTRSDDLAEVVSCSDYILDVTIGDLFSHPFYNGSAEDRTTYTCTVNEVLKAGNKKITNVYAVLPKDGAKIGGRYLLLLNRTSGSFYFYIVSSREHGVHEVDSPTADEIREILKN